MLGLAGAIAVILRSRGVDIRQTSLGGIFLINLALPLFTNISFWGHFGGIVGGALVAVVLTEFQVRRHSTVATAQQAAATLVVALFAASVVIANAGGLIDTVIG